MSRIPEEIADATLGEVVDALYEFSDLRKEHRELRARYNALMDTANRNAAQGDRIRQELKEHTKCQTAENYLLADCMCLEYHECVAALSRVARLEEALPDPEKLEILARWFDLNFGDDRNPEVQTDLREWAKKIRNVLGVK